jgi:hypothetical protein
VNAPDLSLGIEGQAGLISFLVGAWHDFGYEVPPTPECKPVPPLGERSAAAIKAGHEAIEEIDKLTRRLYRLREQLVGELRQDEDLRAALVDAMLARRRQEPQTEPIGVSVGTLALVMADDKSHWRGQLPDGRTAVIRRVLEADGTGTTLFVPTVYESALDFVTGPECGGVLDAAQWVDGHVQVTR